MQMTKRNISFLTAIAILYFLIILCGYGCSKYNELATLRNQGITNYDTTSKLSKRDSVIYPFYKEVIIYYDLDSQRVERTFFLLKFIAPGKTDTDVVLLRKDTVLRKEK